MKDKNEKIGSNSADENLTYQFNYKDHSIEVLGAFGWNEEWWNHEFPLLIDSEPYLLYHEGGWRITNQYGLKKVTLGDIDFKNYKKLEMPDELVASLDDFPMVQFKILFDYMSATNYINVILSREVIDENNGLDGRMDSKDIIERHHLNIRQKLHSSLRERIEKSKNSIKQKDKKPITNNPHLEK